MLFIIYREWFGKSEIVSIAYLYINLIVGGWLVMEPWLTWSIFQEVNVGKNKGKIVDEYTYAQYVDPDYRKKRLNRYIQYLHIYKNFRY